VIAIAKLKRGATCSARRTSGEAGLRPAFGRPVASANARLKPALDCGGLALEILDRPERVDPTAPAEQILRRQEQLVRSRPG